MLMSLGLLWFARKEGKGKGKKRKEKGANNWCFRLVANYLVVLHFVVMSSIAVAAFGKTEFKC